MVCGKSQTLLDLYTAAVTAFHTSQDLSGTLLPDHPQYGRAGPQRSGPKCTAPCEEVVLDHAEEHGCRQNDAILAEIPDA
jgi:hypothetical protein